MRTEQPVVRAERRLAGRRPADGDSPDASDVHAPHASAESPESAEPPANGTAATHESDTSLVRWLPASTAGGPAAWWATVRADPGRAGVVGLGVVGAAAVLLTVITLLRDDGPVIASAKLPPVQMVSSATSAGAFPAGTPPAVAAEGPIVVSVVGLVHQPGLVTLSPGARTADAIAAAGGAFSGADLAGINMARRVADGEQIVVGLAASPGAPPTLGSSVVAPAAAGGTQPPQALASGPVNLNTATMQQLDTLPGVGPVTAAAIVSWRDSNGSFSSVDQLGEVDGIGPARLEKLRNLVAV